MHGPAETVSQGYAKYAGNVGTEGSEQPCESKAINSNEDSTTEAESISGAHAHEVIIIDVHPDANSDVNNSRSSLPIKEITQKVSGVRMCTVVA